MKKILLLGGSAQQIVAIKKAKEMGLYTILCDFLPNNPGQKFADKFYLVSTTDKDAILEVAKKEEVEGILAYASDPAAPTAAYVSEKLGLPTSPYKSVEILSNKDLYRKFLSDNNFCTPKAMDFESLEEAKANINVFKLPVILKPVDSSGSKGVSKLNKVEELDELFNDAMRFSRRKKVIIEEYVEMYKYQIAGDGFSLEGKLVFRCFGNDHFDPKSKNPFVPISASFPYIMPEEIHNKIHDEIQRLISLLGMKTNAYNFDMRIDKDMNVYLMEVGPRDGGNYIPQIIKYSTGVDLVEYSIKAAMGFDCSDITMKPQNGYWSYYSVHSYKAGKLKELKISEKAKNENIVDYYLNYKEGDFVPEYTGSNGTLGILIMKFSSLEEMIDMMENAEKWIEVIVE